MQYSDGDKIELGDAVLLEGGAHGVIVGTIEEGAFLPPYVAAEWSYLGRGVLIDSDDAGLMHYGEPDEAWRLLGRA